MTELKTLHPAIRTSLPFLTPPQKRGMTATAAAIASATCRVCRVEVDAILKRHQGKGVARARKLAMYLTRRLNPGMSFPTIARLFERHYSTVHGAWQEVGQRIGAGEPDILADIALIEERLGLAAEVRLRRE